MRLIDADAPEIQNCEGVAREIVLGLIAKQPTVNAVPVARAYWIPSIGGLYPVSRCSNPKCERLCETDGSFPYCPNCGARMDGGAV